MQLGYLPSEILFEISTFLGFRDFLHFSSVNKHFFNSFEKSHLWKGYYERVSSAVPTEKSSKEFKKSSTWRDNFIVLVKNFPFVINFAFSENEILELCEDVMKIVEKEKNCVHVSGRTILFGDLRGVYDDLTLLSAEIDKLESTHSKSAYDNIVFLGNFLPKGWKFPLISDRNLHPTELLFKLFRLKKKYPDKIFLIIGESEVLDSLKFVYEDVLEKPNSKYGYEDVNHNEEDDGEYDDLPLFDEYNEDEPIIDKKKYGKLNDSTKFMVNFFEPIVRTLSKLPVCCVINDQYFGVSGGLTPEIEKLEQFNSEGFNRFEAFGFEKLNEQTDHAHPFSSLLSNDYMQYSTGYHYYSGQKYDYKEEWGMRQRGAGWIFGKKVTSRFLKSGNLKGIITANTLIPEGYEILQDGMLFKVCSTLVLKRCRGQKSSNASCLLLKKDDDPVVITVSGDKAEYTEDIEKVDYFL